MKKYLLIFCLIGSLIGEVKDKDMALSPVVTYWKTLTIEEKETFFPPCPDPNSKLRVGSFANEKRLEKVKEFKYNEDKTQCLPIWEDVTYVDQWMPEPTLVINTVIIASIAATSPALINIIKGITKNIMKKITSSQGSKKNDNASQSD